MGPLRILWSGSAVVAAWKPAGLPVQPDRSGDTDMLSVLRVQLEKPGLQLIHRLDRPVSGVVLFAHTAQATAALSRDFRERQVQKVYWAVVEGQLMEPLDLIAELAHDPRSHKARVVQNTTGQGSSRLVVRPLAQGDRYTLVEVVPAGGAFHQIRAQLAAAGFPIKGDVKYGARRGEKDRSILLHARSIDFVLPDTGSRMHVEAPIPEVPLWHALAGSLAEDT